MLDTNIHTRPSKPCNISKNSTLLLPRICPCRRRRRRGPRGGRRRREEAGGGGDLPVECPSLPSGARILLYHLHVCIHGHNHNSSHPPTPPSIGPGWTSGAPPPPQADGSRSSMSITAICRHHTFQQLWGPCQKTLREEEGGRVEANQGMHPLLLPWRAGPVCTTHPHTRRGAMPHHE
jgi:hypothetical protein